MTPRPARSRTLLVGVALAAAVTGGCGGQPAMHLSRSAAHGTMTQSKAPTKTTALLRALQARSVYAMAGDDRLHAGLGVLDSHGLAPAKVKPTAPLMSNISGNGRQVVMGAAGLVPGDYTDGVYKLSSDHRSLITLAKPSMDLYGPTIAADGTVAAVQPDGGFSLRREPSGSWVHDERLATTPLSSLAWGSAGDAFTITHANQPTARLIQLPAAGSARTIGTAYCGSGVLHAPNAPKVAITLPVTNRRSGACGHDRAHVISLLGGDVRTLPTGWNPVAWSKNSNALLVARGHELGIWHLRTRRLSATTDVGVHVWMAAPLWKQ